MENEYAIIFIIIFVRVCGIELVQFIIVIDQDDVYTYTCIHIHNIYIYCDGHFILLVILISLCTLIEYNAMDFRQVFSTC